MHPPNWVVEEMQRIHPKLRLGWCSDYMEDDLLDEVFPEGHFVVIQLYHPRDARCTGYSPYPAQWPIFGKDFDRLAWTPIYKFRVTPQEVFGGAVLARIKYFLEPLRKSFHEAAAETNYAAKVKNDDMVGEIADRMWRCSGDGAPIVANKHLTDAEKSLLTDGVEDSAPPITEEKFSPSGEGIKLR